MGDERHVDKLLVGDEGVAEVAVVAQAVTVVGHNERQRVAGVFAPGQPVEQTAQVVVLVGHFGVVDVVEHARLQFVQRLGQRRGPAIRLAVPGAQDGARLLAVAEVGRDAVNELARRPEGQVGFHQVEEEEERPIALGRLALLQKGHHVVHRALILPLEVGHLRPQRRQKGVEGDAEGQIRLAEEVLDRVGDAAQELGIGLGHAVHGPRPRVRVARQAGEGPAVVIERAEAALEAVVEHADQRVIAEADRLVAQLAQHLGQVGPAAADAV